MIKVLFVCLGNICRSPAAEATLNHLAQKYNLQNKIIGESAGTSGHHAGDPADSRMRTHAQKREIEITTISRQFTEQDFKKYDFIITMDRSNYHNVMKLDPDQKFIDKVIPMSHLCQKNPITEVPDPYYGGDDGFEFVLDLVEDGCRGLLDRVNLKSYE
jgi:protein-tyrosine phosphatase